MQSTKKVLFCVGAKGPAQTESLIARIPEQMAKYVSSYKCVKDMDEYAALSEEDKNVDIVVVQLGTTCSGPVLKDQVINNANLKWVHSLSAGIDGYVAVQEFRESEIPLTNAKGAFSTILGEFIALGVLYHTKHLERFMQRKAEKKTSKKKPKTTRKWQTAQQWEVANCAPTYRGSMSDPSIEWELCSVLSDMNKRVISWDLEIKSDKSKCFNVPRQFIREVVDGGDHE